MIKILHLLAVSTSNSVIEAVSVNDILAVALMKEVHKEMAKIRYDREEFQPVIDIEKRCIKYPNGSMIRFTHYLNTIDTQGRQRQVLYYVAGTDIDPEILYELERRTEKMVIKDLGYE